MPSANQYGNSSITITVTDAGNLTATESFIMTVNGVNDTPEMTSIENQITDEDTATRSISFTVTDIETAGCSHGITFGSSDITLIPVENICYTCSAGVFYLSITPATNKSGFSTITITATDAGSSTATETFLLLVNSVRNPISIPTLNEYGIILFICLLILVSIKRIRDCSPSLKRIVTIPS
ncbi:MAG: hypothetical protein OMM_15320, partial [Candidatus Magnetoglobus multicellularis str. Araruama]